MVLLDFDNAYFNLSNRPTYDWLTHEFNLLISGVLEHSPMVDRVDIRLYGGWTEDGSLTKKASLVQQALAAGVRFPLVTPDKRILQGDVALATRLLAMPGIEWPNLLKTHQGLPRLRLVRARLPPECLQSAHQCPLRLFKHFADPCGKCPVDSCSVTARQAFETLEQKMVDTLLTCDLLDCAATDCLVYLVTGDIDLLPALLVATTRQTAIQMVPRNRFVLCWMAGESSLSIYAQLLANAGVHTTHRRCQ